MLWFCIDIRSIPSVDPEEVPWVSLAVLFLLCLEISLLFEEQCWSDLKMNTLLRCTKYLLIFCVSAMEGLDIPTLLSLVGIRKETYTFSLERNLSNHLFQEVRMGCERVLTGRKLTQCLPSPEDVKMALEEYKLSLEIEGLGVQTWSWASVKNQYISFPSLPFKNRELGTFFSLATVLFLQCYYSLKKYLYLKDLWYFLMPLIVWNYWSLIFCLILSFCFPGFDHMGELF